MFDTLFGNIGGTMHNRQQYAAQASQYAAQASQYGCNQLQNSYPGYAYSIQQAQAQQASLAQGAGLGQWHQAPRKKYRIDGQDMDFEEFIDTLYPDECAEKTHLILKFKKED